MNSTCCLNIILKQIQKNAHSFENKDLPSLLPVLHKMGNLVIQKSLPVSLLKNLVIALKELNKKFIICDDYNNFLKDVNNFCKLSSLCHSYKKTLSVCFFPVLELEVLSILKLCLNVSNVYELTVVRSAVESSILVQACQNSERTTRKISIILKEAFMLSEGNPVVGYFIFCLFKLIDQSFHNIYLLSQELYCIETFFHFPCHLLNEEERELLIKRLINVCIETTNMKMEEIILMYAV